MSTRPVDASTSRTAHPAISAATSSRTFLWRARSTGPAPFRKRCLRPFFHSLQSPAAPPASGISRSRHVARSTHPPDIPPESTSRRKTRSSAGALPSSIPTTRECVVEKVNTPLQQSPAALLRPRCLASAARQGDRRAGPTAPARDQTALHLHGVSVLATATLSAAAVIP